MLHGKARYIRSVGELLNLNIISSNPLFSPTNSKTSKMLSKSVIAVVLACTNVLAAPLEVKQRDAQGYGIYENYGK